MALAASHVGQVSTQERTYSKRLIAQNRVIVLTGTAWSNSPVADIACTAKSTASAAQNDYLSFSALEIRC